MATSASRCRNSGDRACQFAGPAALLVGDAHPVAADRGYCASAEVERLGAQLAADGVVRLFYEAPSRAQQDRAGAGTRAALERGGFIVETSSPGGTLYLTARKAVHRTAR